VFQKSRLHGEFFMQGDIACAEGALAAGCRFFGGYPITPASEIAERMAYRLPLLQGVFIQYEDEIASMAGILGASWAGVKSMTATSGPGFSLMNENIGRHDDGSSLRCCECSKRWTFYRASNLLGTIRHDAS